MRQRTLFCYRKKQTNKKKNGRSRGAAASQHLPPFPPLHTHTPKKNNQGKHFEHKGNPTEKPQPNPQNPRKNSQETLKKFSTEKPPINPKYAMQNTTEKLRENPI